MKKVYKNILGIFLFLIIIVLGGSIIGDLVDLILKERLNKILIYFIKVILIFTMIMLLSKTKTVKNLQESIFGENFRKKK